jgi:hypothetical protein
VGLRLEIAFKIDKKKNQKNEFYFSSRTKIFLTRKRNKRVRGKTKKEYRRSFVRDRRQTLWRSDRSIRVAVTSLPI